MNANDTISIDRNRAALIIQDMQNDVIAEQGRPQSRCATGASPVVGA